MMKTPLDHAANSQARTIEWIVDQGTKAEELRPVEKSARTGCAVVVSGVDANVLGLESRIRM